MQIIYIARLRFLETDTKEGKALQEITQQEYTNIGSALEVIEREIATFEIAPHEEALNPFPFYYPREREISLMIIQALSNHSCSLAYPNLQQLNEYLRTKSPLDYLVVSFHSFRLPSYSVLYIDNTIKVPLALQQEMLKDKDVLVEALQEFGEPVPVGYRRNFESYDLGECLSVLSEFRKLYGFVYSFRQILWVDTSDLTAHEVPRPYYSEDFENILTGEDIELMPF